MINSKLQVEDQTGCDGKGRSAQFWEKENFSKEGEEMRTDLEFYLFLHFFQVAEGGRRFTSLFHPYNSSGILFVPFIIHI